MSRKISLKTGTIIRSEKNIVLVAVLSLFLAFIFFTGSSGIFAQSNTAEIDVLGSTAAAFQQDEIQDPSALQNAGVNLTDYEAAILYLINTTRVNNGLAALQPNQSLTDIARTRSNDMLSRDYFSHYSPEGKTFFNILRECGIVYRAAGENLAHSKPASIGSPEAFLNAWMNSPGHAANILQSKFGIIGVGMTENSGRRIVTTVFRNP